MTPDQTRFLNNRVENFQGCWIWMLSVNHQGYGLFWAEGIQQSAHRWGYQQFRGPIPDGMQLDHLCFRRDCVNPLHLEPVTAKDNKRRAMKPYCANGHKWSEETTYISKRGDRGCIPCLREATRRWRAERAGRTL